MMRPIRITIEEIEVSGAGRVVTLYSGSVEGAHEGDRFDRFDGFAGAVDDTISAVLRRLAQGLDPENSRWEVTVDLRQRT
jgi:hypothetical protein